MSQISNQFLSPMPSKTIKGNDSVSTAQPSDLTVAQVNAILPIFTSTLNGLVPFSGGGTTNFLRADGSWVVAPGASGITALTGDVTASGPGSAAATVAKIQGTTISGTTGTLNVVFSSAPTLTNPVVGTQSQGNSSTLAASTSYVDVAVANAVSGINPAVAVQAATTAAGDTSSFTYSNGVSGVGATLTGPNNTAFTIDGFTFTLVNQRALVKNDTQSPSGAFNGVYYVSALQTVGTGVILVRALDYDQPTDMNNTGAIPVINGTVNGTSSWVLTSKITNVGVDPLTFVQFTQNPANYLLKANNLSDVASKSTSFNNVSPITTTGDLIYSASGATNSRLTIGSTSQALTVVGGIPTWATLTIAGGGTGQVTKAAAFDALQPMTTGGDLIYGGTSGTGTRLANGSAGQFLKSNGTTLAPTWSAPTIALTAPTVQSFLSSSGTYTTPANVLYIRVTMVGGGGGGGGSSTSAASNGANGTAGGNTTFGTTLLVANGGALGPGSVAGGANGGLGGTASLGSGPIGIALSGGQGGGQAYATITGIFSLGAMGGVSALGGASGGGAAGTAADNAIVNSGSGGGGGSGPSNASGSVAGGGGGAGGFINAIITSPLATYSYAVGAAGALGTGGTSGHAGGNGGSGIIIVEEFYQ